MSVVLNIFLIRTTNFNAGITSDTISNVTEKSFSLLGVIVGFVLLLLFFLQEFLKFETNLPYQILKARKEWI